jgi:hypothetical protein
VALLTDIGDLDVHALVNQVEAMTRQIFSGEVTCLEKEDDEVPDDWHFTFNVVDRGDLDAILLRNNAWHTRLCQLPAAAHSLFRLSIDAQ